MSRTIDKTKLLEIEEEIRQIYQSTGELSHRKTSPEQLKLLEDLLVDRCGILNSMLLGNEEEIYHLRRVNNHLSYLRKELYRRVAVMKQSIVKDSAFDDDFEVEGKLEVHYNDETSVLVLKDDAYYGSDFRLMNEVLESFYLLECRSCLGFTVSPGDDDKLDNMAYDEWDGIPICFALHDLCFHKRYSIPDAIRLNDFWAEVTLTAQSITTQSGKRYTPPKRH